MKEIKYYQELTFEVLHKLVEARAKEGHSILSLKAYEIGSKMRGALELKGFYVWHSSGWYISW